ncbi:DUF3895 domain-containing protein [Planococcus alpniumensis]|uniref:DUF3895 domain-containing protein n=1 Tax=Planococcus alpniumensis TaxID=2708345 RepID=UPI001B8C18EF|nr:competence protein CoiA family protein [Planococcus sp. MSAK28401]
MLEAIYEGRNFNLSSHLSSQESVKQEVQRLKKAAEKGAFTCPYCDGVLRLKAGEVKEKHFFHLNNSCVISEASEVYQQQTKRETKSHSVMKEIIYDELKTQEKINDNLHVEYGYVDKAEEKWKYYPDIIVNNKKAELAITILTDVTANKDSNLVRKIKKRNEYFKSKNLKPIWFVEETEQSIDLAHRVVHLWEAELDIAIRMEEDIEWESAIKQLELNNNLFDIFDYHHQSLPTTLDVFSLYYVKSTETNITFTVQRFIKDQLSHPYRAFALNHPYEIKMATALWTEDSMQLSDPIVEEQQREVFVKEALERDEQYMVNDEEELTTSSQPENNPQTTGKVYEDHDIEEILSEYMKEVEVVSADKFSKFLVEECGAPSHKFATGRYQIYGKVCTTLNAMEKEGTIKLVRKDFVNDRLYKVV